MLKVQHDLVDKGFESDYFQAFDFHGE